MNGTRILAGEFAIAIGFVAWQDLKSGYLPWPAVVVRICSAFAILGVLSNASEEFAAALGGGFLVAGFMRYYQSNRALPYGIPYTSQVAPFAPLGTQGAQGQSQGPLNYTPLYFGKGTTS